METLSLNMVAKDIISVKSIVANIVNGASKLATNKYKIVSSRDGKPIISGDLKFDTKTKLNAFNAKLTSLGTAETAGGK